MRKGDLVADEPAVVGAGEVGIGDIIPPRQILQRPGRADTHGEMKAKQ